MKIRQRTYRSGKTVWQVDLGQVEGRRVQRSFATRAEAQKALDHVTVTRQRHGAMASAMSPREMAEIVLARERLAAVGATISEAADFFLAQGARSQRPVRLDELVQRFRDAKLEAGCSTRYHRQLGVSLRSLAGWLPGRMAHEVTRAEVEAWLRSRPRAARTWNGYLGDACTLFEWAKKEGLMRSNPAQALERRRLVEGEVGTLTVPQCRDLLEGALRQPEMMGFVALGLFGGLRPAELARLDWSAVDLEHGTVIVAGSQAKTRRRRVVDLGPAAVAWIRAARVKQQGSLCGRYWDARWRLFRHALGWAVGVGEKRVRRAEVEPVHGPWPHNAMRHTYASMHYAMHQNEAMLQAQMGHESAAMLHRHYRAIKTRSEAEAFWSLRP